ncbi:isoprenoid synthase domain-containing protein [Crepidotus variabilis]|uniref:Isoprenoid synthase domain-containing protein n=1 Tax=Crepidotus variabilis TaxID=179855 RepID=A0A9P6EEY8_9AGAR|nr:isoprenoid synthase domain-containing protein [Crepidotus variabilis]
MSLLRLAYTAASIESILDLLGLFAPSTLTTFVNSCAPKFALAQPATASTVFTSKDNLIRQIVQDFLNDVHYIQPDIPQNNRLVQDVLSELKSWNIQDGRPWTFYIKVAEHSAGMAELSYHHHPYAVKKQIAMFTVFMLYMDDLADRMPDALSDFQRRMIFGLPQLNPVLEHFPTHLTGFYDFYDPLCANSIVAAALEYVTGTALETRREMSTMPPHPDATSWPYFLRAKTGVAPAYAFMIFYGDRHSNISYFLQTIPDINAFIDLTNDVLSFYKEERAGESHNYLHNRARCRGATALSTCAEVAKECAVLDERISKVSATTALKTLEAWKTFKTGYITFHVALPRYRLAEIGI